MSGAEPTGDEADVRSEPVREGALEIFGSIADDGYPFGLEPQANSLRREKWAVAIVPLAADQLASRDDDRGSRARVRQEAEAVAIRLAVTTNAVPAGSSTRFPFTRTRTLSGSRSASWRRRPSNDFRWPRSSVPL